MAGLIWFVQIVHYPLFARVGRDAFPSYEAAHRRRTLPLAGVPMAVEAITAVLLPSHLPAGVPPLLAWAGLVLLAAIWTSTAIFQLPRHRWLSRGFDAGVHRALVESNWIRTVGWTLRAALVVAMLALAMD
jgi:hypothetical protein